MNENEAVETRAFLDGWIPHTLVAVATVIILVVLLVVQPWSGSVRTIINSVESCRMITYSVIIDDTGRFESVQEMAYIAPDRVHITVILDSTKQEMIVIGEDVYTNDERNAAGVYTGIAISSSVSSMIPSKEHTRETLEQLTDVTELEIERIDGVAYRHYRGRMDFVKGLEEQIAGLDPEQPKYEDMLEALESQIEMMEEIISNIEVWVGRNDGFVRQISFEVQLPSEEGEQLYTQNMLLKYYDFNESIIIEPPLDASGELLPGWYLVSS